MTLKLFLIGILIAFLIATALLLIVKIMEPRLLFYPSKDLASTPLSLGLEFRDVIIESKGFNIHGWFLPEQGSDVYLIFYHGNAGNVSNNLEFARMVQVYKVNLLMIDYRGYGRSDGFPTIDGVEEDAIATMAWLINNFKVDPTKIILWGRSLGVAMAMATAERYANIGGVILESGFVSFRRIARYYYPIIPACFISNALDSGARMASLASPKLIIHGTHDTTIPFAHARELFALAQDPKQFMSVKFGGHNDVAHVGGQGYIRIIGKWIEDLKSK
ncbi:MAG TPA: alpha/beta hydrolase [Nitrospinota bacterium]|nr:alpha/beta hydrolase [Nitrospinota bacterium]|tara:strand:+ start:119295 stop:120119 length:825 start_codon:yes stop_codon:yes gene_type:complete